MWYPAGAIGMFGDLGLFVGCCLSLATPVLIQRWPLPQGLVMPRYRPWQHGCWIAAGFLLLGMMIQRFREDGWSLFFYLPFVYGLLVGSGIDLGCRILPNRLLLIMLLWGGIFLPFQPPMKRWLSMVGMVVVFGVMALFARLGGIGFGDVKLAGIIGFFLGPYAGFSALLTAFVVGGIVAAALLASGRYRRSSEIPFGPFLALGGWVSLFVAGG